MGYNAFNIIISPNDKTPPRMMEMPGSMLPGLFRISIPPFTPPKYVHRETFLFVPVEVLEGGWYGGFFIESRCSILFYHKSRSQQRRTKCT